MEGKLREECGVIGICGTDMEEAVSSVYLGMYALQHRGQESCGIALNRDGGIWGHKDVGLVNEVFTKEALSSLGQGSGAFNAAVGHVRYGTSGGVSRANAQPMVIYHRNGSIALAHNGNISNAPSLRAGLEMQGSIFHSTSDTEVIAYAVTRARLQHPELSEALKAAMERLEGAYSIVLTAGNELAAVRDPRGFRPLCIGRREDGGHVFASESCALDAVNAKFVRDVLPGEIVIADREGLRSYTGGTKREKMSMCVFEYIYFARPDSVIEGASVHAVRKKLGAYLAREHRVEADVVIGVPDSGIDAAMGYAEEAGIPYALGFIKNKYIGRSFIRPTQAERSSDVRIKLNPISETVRGKRVVMIDDSIVRGTTCARIVGLLRDCGAREVHVRVSAPPFRHECYFGTDIDSPECLIATNRTVGEMTRAIGADSLGFLGLGSVGLLGEKLGVGFCDACFTGNYPVLPDRADPADERRKCMGRYWI